MEILFSKRNGWHRVWNWRRCPPIRKFFHLGFVFGPFLVLTCNHRRLRCIHGAELEKTMRNIFGERNTSRVAYVHCLDCDQPLYNRPRLKKCTLNGFAHMGGV